MRRPISKVQAFANAVFALLVLGIATWGGLQIASRRWAWQETFLVRAEFPVIGGLEPGARVRLQGIDAGVVESIAVPEAPGKPVGLTFRIDSKLRGLLRKDARARIATQGVVGAKVIEIDPGTPSASTVAPGDLIASETPVDFADVLKDARGALDRLNVAVTAAEKGIDEITEIARSIREGKGSLGKLVQDDEAHRKLMELADSGNKTLHGLDENLNALKRTWPISRYFNDRSYYDRERVLYQPGARRNARVFAAEELFEPGRSVLSPQGRVQLDNLGTWLKIAQKANTELVIAAFTDEGRDPDLAQILTQEQADAVKKYLISRHRVDSAGWFSSRKIASVGFGTHIPRTLEPGSGNPPPARRLEIILFTPQG